MLLALLLFYMKFYGDLENIGFELNTYDLCAASRIKIGKQQTVIIHVDDVISSNVKPKVNNKFKE